MEWTDEQKKVIEARMQNILVSAAAGSGKTAVLVERIIRLVLDDKHPVDVDRLLVVTFTKAAAAEMKERVLKTLSQEAGKHPENIHLQKQLTYIHNAEICTIDSFCAKIFKEYFDKLDLDPAMTLVDEIETQMLENDVVDQMMEEKYAQASPEFIKVADAYNSAKRQDELGKVIIKLYRKSTSQVDPKEWIRSCAEAYNIKDKNQLLNTKWFQNIFIISDYVLELCRSNVEEILKLAAGEDGHESYEKKFKPCLSDIYNLLGWVEQNKSGQVETDKKNRLDQVETYFDQLRGNILSLDLRDLKVGKAKCDPDIKARIKELHGQAKEKLKEIKELYFQQTFDELATDIFGCRDCVNEIVSLTLEFAERFMAKKQEKCVMDFNDQEHYVLEILNERDESGDFIPSQTARELALQYEEIMIDEYQDSNQVQDKILSSLSGGKGYNNIFMVGDVKQSIYKFRLADPGLFLDKLGSYSSSEDAEFRKIILGKNFRSRREIIDSTNYIFRNIMHQDAGGIEYNDEHALNYAADYPELPEGQNNNTEFLLVDKIDGESEMRAVAARIKQLTDPAGNFKIYKDKEYVTPKYSDIVILLRSISSVGADFVKILEEEGVPAYCDPKSGFYDAREIKVLLDFLKIIDNPLQDIPLATVLKSHMYGFSSEELAKIRILNRRDNLYNSLEAYMEEGEDLSLRVKVAGFVKELEEFRDKSFYVGVYDLINAIVEKKDYTEFISALPGGNRRYKNVEILKEKASLYDQGIYKGLFNFIRYIDKIKENNKEEGEASTVTEEDNVVRIMTIHKSKGLQFPVVFVSKLGRELRSRNDALNINIHDKMGIGINYIDPELGVKNDTIINKMIMNQLREDEYAEDLRILYVAMTRAQEKLILTTEYKKNKSGSCVSKWLESRKDEGFRLSCDRILGAGSLADWIGMSLVKNRAMDQVIKQEGELISDYPVCYDEDICFNVCMVSEEESELESEKEKISNEIGKDMLIKWDLDQVYDEVLKSRLEKNINWVRPYKVDDSIPAKASVTELKTMFGYEYNEEEDGAYSPVLLLAGDQASTEMATKTKPAINVDRIEPEFISSRVEGRLKGNKLGTAYHRIFELFDMDMEPSLDNIKNMMDRLLSEKYITRLTYDSIDRKKLYMFTKTSLYQRMRRAYNSGQLYREKPFLMGVEAQKIIKGCQSDEKILVQGIIDVCFIEDGKYVIADYKTDNVLNTDILADKYAFQLDCYKKAVEKIDGREVSELIIYSVKLGEERSL